MPGALDLIPLFPAIALALGGCALLLSEAFTSGGNRAHQAPLAAASAALALLLIPISRALGAQASLIYGGMARADLFGAFVGAIIAAGLLIAVPLSASFLRRLEAERGEYYALLLFAGSGMMLLAMASDLIMLFVSLEVMSLSTYALAAWLRRTKRSTEAAFKYFILGALSSGLFLYGAALAYGATGSTRLDVIAVELAKLVRGAPGGALPLLPMAAVALLVAGFAFKVAAVPFHMWAPDVYEGAPTPVTAFMAIGVKAAAFAAFFRVLAVGFGPAGEHWGMLITLLAIVTMLGGNLLALPQRNVKRMLAYSSIAHAGYLLIGLSAASGGRGFVSGGQGLLFYLASYAVTALGAFGLAAYVEGKELDAANAWDLERFAGLGKRSPGLAFAMAFFMLSLAGIPPTGGFIAKLLIFRSALDAGQLWLAIIGIATSAIGAWYYLRVVVYLYFREPSESAAELGAPGEDMGAPGGFRWVAGLALLLVLAMGLMPQPLIALAQRGAASLF